MSSIEAIFLGLVQGLTEFLPVSSSGHLTIFKEILGIDSDNLTFEIAVHAATVLSTIVVFRSEIMKLFKGFFSKGMNDDKRYVFMILVSMIPVFVVGMFFKDFVESIFGSGLLIVGIMLMVTASLLFFSELLTKKQDKKQNTDSGINSNDSGKSLNMAKAFIIGCAQALAVLPGLSRSGSTISTGLLLGVRKREIAQFSFLMVLIPILGEAFLELVGGDFTSSGENSIGVFPLLAGFLAAFVSGLFACKFMINMVKKARLWGFSFYCAVVGIACIVYTILQ